MKNAEFVHTFTKQHSARIQNWLWIVRFFHKMRAYKKEGDFNTGLQQMYLSRLYIKNYRSISETDILFTKWKNVIVGRNNAWKSNIIKAIDVVLWENSPTYNKSENIVESDFFNENTEEPIFIFCELTREKTWIWFEPINFEPIKKWTFFGIQKMSANLEFCFKDISQPVHNSLFHFEKEEGQAELDDKSSWYSKRWIWGKPYCKTGFEAEFWDVSKVIFGLMVEKIDDRLQKHLVMLYTNDNEKWKVWCNAWQLRSTFLQSAIIPAFRDPKDQLRISSYSWYGKLLKNYVDGNNAALNDAFAEVKKAWQDVFGILQSHVCDAKINVAFPNTEISFQFNPEKQEVYKNAQIYVNDWFNSPLQNKGSWIQSAVIIGLFDFYIRNIAHSGGSLLAIEEPELYLHPHWRRVISDRLDAFLDGWKNQVIIATHSSEFIVPLAADLNIIVLRKDRENGTIWVNLDFSTPDRKQMLIKKEMAEMFFADLVILTEDCKHFIEEVSKIVWKSNPDLWENWLNNHNISVLNCGWKTWFWKYRELLDEARIPNYIFGDFDFMRDGGIEKCLSDKETKDKLNAIKWKITTAFPDLGDDLIKELVAHFWAKDYGQVAKVSKQITAEARKRAAPSSYKTLSDIEKAHHQEIKEFLESIRSKGIYLLEWELENLFLPWKEPCSDKEKGVVETIGKMIENWETIDEYINISQIHDFLGLVISHLETQKTNPTVGKVVEEARPVPKKAVPAEISIEDIPF